MKTTVEIPDSLFAEAKTLADYRGITLRQLILEALRAATAQQPAAFHLRDASFPGKGSNPQHPWNRVRRMIYEGRGE
jgi:hypothetical protein